MYWTAFLVLLVVCVTVNIATVAWLAGLVSSGAVLAWVLAMALVTAGMTITVHGLVRLARQPVVVKKPPPRGRHYRI